MSAEPVLIIELDDWGIFLVWDENKEAITVMTNKNTEVVSVMTKKMISLCSVNQLRSKQKSTNEVICKLFVMLAESKEGREIFKYSWKYTVG